MASGGICRRGLTVDFDAPRLVIPCQCARMAASLMLEGDDKESPIQFSSQSSSWLNGRGASGRSDLRTRCGDR